MSMEVFSRFQDLLDTPPDIIPNFVVIGSEDGKRLEFVDPDELRVHFFTELSDTPSTYEGQANKVLVVKSDESGLEFKNLRVEYKQVEESDIWMVHHNLGFKPIVQVYNNGWAEIECHVEHVDNNTVKIMLNQPMNGYVVLTM